jgi:hypothetical protein
MMGAQNRYMKNIKNVLMEQRLKHMKEINIQSRYKTFNIEDKGHADEKRKLAMKKQKSSPTGPNMFNNKLTRQDYSSNQRMDLHTPKGSIESSMMVGIKRSEYEQYHTNRTGFTGITGAGTSKKDPSYQSLKNKFFASAELHMESSSIDIPKSNTDLSFILRKRLENIEHEMSQFNSILTDFSVACDFELQNFTQNMTSL